MDPAELKIQVARVNNAFYARVFEDPWLNQLFQGVPRAHLEDQQTDFIVGALGGARKYYGKSPADAHPHVFVTEEVWSAREGHLRAAFHETGFPEEYRTRWLRVDEAFKQAILKRSVADCAKRYSDDEILSVPERQASGSAGP